MYYKNDEHQKRYHELLERDETKDNDAERNAFFYILAAEDNLYRNHEEIYDFSRREIKSEYRYLEGEEYINNTPKFTLREKTLIKLIINLFNSHHFQGINPSNIFGYQMGREIPCIALVAIGIRYGIPIDLPYFD